MTTTVTLTTHDWPVEVTMEDKVDYTTSVGRVRSHALTTERVEPHSEKSFHITNTRSISFVELPTPEAEVESASQAA